MGWHGQKRMWAIKKMDELDALNVTIERLWTQDSKKTLDIPRLLMG
jgi:hypothetical protein